MKILGKFGNFAEIRLVRVCYPGGVLSRFGLEIFAVAFWCIADVIVSSLAVVEVRSGVLRLAFLQFFDVSFDFVFKSYDLLYCKQ